MEKRNPRDAFGKKLQEVGTLNKDVVVLDADLSSSTKTHYFAKTFPDRFFNVGVQEQNMMSVAAGLALTGKIVFLATFAIFVCRGWEQIRQTIALDNLNVKIFGSHGGITVGPDGVSHHALEDLALMRVIPNMTVIAPIDSTEMEQVVETVVAHPGPVYIRGCRIDMPEIVEKRNHFEIGKGSCLRDGKDVTIVTTGYLTHTCLQVANYLQMSGVSSSIVAMSTVKPLDTELLLHCAGSTGSVVTVEDHSVIGGLGDAVSECLMEHKLVSMLRIGIPDIFTRSGSPESLLKKYNLTPRSIVATIETFMRHKPRR